jgi:hypothetical protein
LLEDRIKLKYRSKWIGTFVDKADNRESFGAQLLYNLFQGLAVRFSMCLDHCCKNVFFFGRNI